MLAGVTLASLAAAQTPVPLPKVTALPATKDSFPFLEANRNLRPYNLAKVGYTEQEFLIGGAANVYDWAPDGTLSVKTPKRAVYDADTGALSRKSCALQRHGGGRDLKRSA